MARISTYNYSIIDEHKQKVFIPWLNIEFRGVLSLITMLVGMATIIVVIGTLLSFVLGANGYLIAMLISIIFAFVYFTLTKEINETTGKTRLMEIYYEDIKRYRRIYDSQGEKHYLKGRKEGVIFVACR